MMTPLVVLLLAAAAPARSFSIDAPASEVRYHVVHKLHRVDGRSSTLEGKAVLQPDGGILAMVRIPAASFQSGDGNRDAHLVEVLETSKFPFVVFKGVARLEGTLLAASAGVTKRSLAMTGEVELHGVRRPVTVPLDLELRPDGSVRARGSFEVSLDAHGVERPALLFVKVEDVCRIDVDLVAREVKP
jgi:polyisoprenoid-binding protein YceI